MTYLKQIKTGLFQGFGIILMLFFSGVVYSAYVSISNVGDTDILTSDTFNKVLENQRTLKTDIENIPIGTVPSTAVMAFASDSCPTGWSEYTALQGKFIRGADTGANNDPDFATRTGGTGARKIGSTQNDELKSHSHQLKQKEGLAAAHGSVARSSASPSILETSTTGGSETRPKNVYLLYCIKN